MSGTRSKSHGFGIGFYSHLAIRFFGSFAVQLQAVVLGWQMFEFTRDPLSLGLVGLAEAIPALSLALFAGYFVDRSSIKLLLGGVVGVSFISILMAMLAQNPGQLYTAAFLTGIARSFASPSHQSLISKILNREQINVGVAASTSAMKLAYISGPAVGGILLGIWGTNVAYTVGLFSLAIAFLSVFFLPSLGPTSSSELKQIRFRDSLFAGLRFVFQNKTLLSVLSLDMFAVLFGGVTALLPMVASEILKVGPTGLGYLRAAPAVGALVMSAWLIRKPINRNAGRTLLVVVAGFGFCILVFAASRNYLLSLTALFVSGALDSVSMVIRGAIVQLSSPADMKGRIAAVNSIFIGSSNELGAVESGIAARLLGLIPSIYFGGCMTLLIVYLVYQFNPRLAELHLEDLEEQQ